MSQMMPGAISVTRLRPYKTLSLDGQPSGTPHVHFVCSEMYVVIAGNGAVEFIDQDGFSRVDLLPGAVVLFSPGTFHRIINPDKNLEILVIMQNQGLPEHGDAAVSFMPEYLVDAATFHNAMQVNEERDATARRDRGVEGFLHFKHIFEQDNLAGRDALAAFYQQVTPYITSNAKQWANIVQTGAAADTQASLDRIANVMKGDLSYLLAASHQHYPPHEYKKFGFCGLLDPLHNRDNT